MTASPRELAVGERVRFTKGPLGIIGADHLYRMLPEVVDVGDEGEIAAGEDGPFAMPTGWALVKIEPGTGYFRDDDGRGDVVDRYVPVHPAMIELVP